MDVNWGIHEKCPEGFEAAEEFWLFLAYSSENLNLEWYNKLL